jgi:hypothetical protein
MRKVGQLLRNSQVLRGINSCRGREGEHPETENVAFSCHSRGGPGGNPGVVSTWRLRCKRSVLGS